MQESREGRWKSGWRRLRDLDHHREDPLLKPAVRLRRIPRVSTLSRALRRLDSGVLDHLRKVMREMVLQRVEVPGGSRATLDFDGTLLNTRSRETEGTAVGYNRKAKGSRTYSPPP